MVAFLLTICTVKSSHIAWITWSFTTLRKAAFSRIDDNLDTLAGSNTFSTLDWFSTSLTSLHNHSLVLEEDGLYDWIFTIGSELWQFTMMPFGLGNAPATFERLMETVLRGLSWKMSFASFTWTTSSSSEDYSKNTFITLSTYFHAQEEPISTPNTNKCQLFRKKVY